jgi:hypothetical protein
MIANPLFELRICVLIYLIYVTSDMIFLSGADNMALQLTHRFLLKRRWNLSTENAYSPAGLSCSDGINIDIGDLPVLEALKGDGVGGILGADLLMMCDLVRFRGMNERSPTMTLWKNEGRE